MIFLKFTGFFRGYVDYRKILVLQETVEKKRGANESHRKRAIILRKTKYAGDLAVDLPTSDLDERYCTV